MLVESISFGGNKFLKLYFYIILEVETAWNEGLLHYCAKATGHFTLFFLLFLRAASMNFSLCIQIM